MNFMYSAILNVSISMKEKNLVGGKCVSKKRVSGVESGWDIPHSLHPPTSSHCRICVCVCVCAFSDPLLITWNALHYFNQSLCSQITKTKSILAAPTSQLLVYTLIVKLPVSYLFVAECQCVKLLKFSSGFFFPVHTADKGWPNLR